MCINSDTIKSVSLLIRFLSKRHIWPFHFLSIFRNIKKDKSLETKKVCFFDLDGTLTLEDGPGAIIRRSYLYPVWSDIRKSDKSRSWVIITNQTHFARGKSVKLLDFLTYIFSLLKIIRELRIDALLVCHHHPNASNAKLREDCQFRKPSGSLLTSYAYKKKVDLSQATLIGDRITDMIAASSAGIPKSFLIYNLRMFEENQSNKIYAANHAFFSLLTSQNDASFVRSFNEFV